MTPAIRPAAQRIFAYLSQTDPLPDLTCDAVIGFGTFDLALPRYCGELYARKRVRRIIFTGGIGAGTADLGGPEADVWRDDLLRTFPVIPAEHVIAENRSTNTAENIRFTADLLGRDFPELVFGEGLRTALIVASPSRLRRAWLTMQKLQPGVQTFRALPGADFDREYTIHESKGIPFLPHLRGEIERIRDYPTRGWIAEESLPAEILEAHATLQELR